MLVYYLFIIKKDQNLAFFVSFLHKTDFDDLMMTQISNLTSNLKLPFHTKILLAAAASIIKQSPVFRLSWLKGAFSSSLISNDPESFVTW